MRDLIIMRGAPGSGKSTWIEMNGFKPYTISSDDIRLMFSSPTRDWKTGDMSISQDNDKDVWKLLFELVERRMKNGDLTVVDATNPQISKWKDLAEKYRYRIWVKELDTTIEECLKRNERRDELKRVPEQAVKKIYDSISRNNIPKYATILNEDFFIESDMLQDAEKYENIYVFGDIHGCFHPLEHFFKDNPVLENNLYIFVGDYLDRGIQNKEVLEFFFSVMNMGNFVFLEGNHSWENKWANDLLDEIKSEEFLRYTLPQIECIDKKQIREFCRRWRQMFFFKRTINGNDSRFFISHAGFGYLPYRFRAVSTKDYIKGSSYHDDVDKEFDLKNYDNIYQIHGHRNVYEYPMNEFKHSFNLCSSVESGQPLRIMQISDKGFDFLEYDNPVHSNRIDNSKFKHSKSLLNVNTVDELIQCLRSSPKYIIEKDLGNGMSSFNFSKDVFFSSKWNELNKMARGLFINVENKEIIARSYNKFFNYQEGDKNSTEWLKTNLQFPVVAYRKYNGYLGILSVYDGRLQFFSKTTNSGEYALKFKEVFESLLSKDTQDKIFKYLETSGSSFVFEVIEPQFDPHIIRYDVPMIVLLDEIDNSIKFSKRRYEDLIQLSKEFGLKVKEKEKVFNSFEEILSALESSQSESYISGEKIEGWVFEDSNGYMFKLKTPFYKYWKTMRSLKEKLQNGKNVDFKQDPFFMWMRDLSIEDLNKSIIELRDQWSKENESKSRICK